MSLRWRLALAMGFLLLTMVALVSIAAYLTTDARVRDEVDASLTQRSSALRLLLDQPKTADDGRRLPETAGPAQLLDARGVIVQAVGAVPLPVNLREIYLSQKGGRNYTHTVTAAGDRYRLQTVALASGGAVQVARDLEPTEDTLASLRRRYAAVSGLVAVLAAILGWLLAGWLTRPVVRLTSAAELVASTGDLDAPIDTAGRDETARLAQAFSSMLGALRESRARQRQLVQDAGHELRTPVTSIRTNVDVLRRHGDLETSERTQILDDVNTELTQVSALVEELVLLASGDVDDDAVTTVRVDDLVTRLVERARRRLGREIISDTEPWRVDGSLRGIERAVDNLLSNAGKFSPPESAIEVTLRDGRISVRDHGPGIAPEDLPYVFQRFYRATAARTQPGSGLGLAMVDQIARAHGGEPFAYNHPDGGAVVGFSLPESGPVDGSVGSS